MLTKILEKEINRYRQTFKEIQGGKNGDIEVLLLNTSIRFLANNLDTGHILIEIAGNDKLDKRLRVVQHKDLATKASFLEMIRPYSYYGSNQDLEYLIQFWQENGNNHKLTYLENVQGRHKDDNADFWVLANEVVFLSNAKPDNAIEKVWGSGNYVGKRVLYVLPYNETVDFIIGSTWYYIKNSSLGGDYKLQKIANNDDFLPLGELLNIWLSQYGNSVLLYSVLGWFCACVYMQEVLLLRGNKFPMFALSGLTQSGKTSLIRNLFYFWGIDATPSDYTQTSAFVELKQLSQMMNAPIWRDEYRETGRAKEKETILRSLYDRSNVNKGTASQKMISYKPNSTILLSGESVTLDPAIRRRFIYFELKDFFKLNGEQWMKASGNAEAYNWQLFYLALERGFDRKVFNKCFSRAEEIYTLNDNKEECLTYAAFCAVFGEEYFEDIIERCKIFWRDVETSGGESLTRKTIVEHLFTYIVDECDGRGWFENFDRYKIEPAFALKLFKVTNRFIYVKVSALVAEVFKVGFRYETTLTQKSVREAFIDHFKQPIERLTWLKTRAKGIRVPLSMIHPQSDLATIVENVKMLQTEYADSQGVNNFFKEESNNI